MHKDSIYKLKRQTLNYIKNIALGNKLVTELDYKYQKEKKDLNEIGKKYCN